VIALVIGPLISRLQPTALQEADRGLSTLSFATLIEHVDASAG
jgi:hypothetical protein